MEIGKELLKDQLPINPTDKYDNYQIRHSIRIK